MLVLFLKETLLNAPGTGSVILHDAAAGRWLNFSNPRQIYQAGRMEEVLPLMEEIQKKIDNTRLYAAGFVSYDASPAFDASLSVHPSGDFPLLWFGLYDAPESIDLPSPPGESITPDWVPSVTEEEFYRQIEAVKAQIAAGNSYQVNFTYRLHTQMTGDFWPFFLQIQAAQKARYGAYIQTGEWTVCSASPELFFSLQGDKIISRPMKGTVPRAPEAAEDQLRAEWLGNSEKNRAENLMIVDMIRNDLGRIARPGSVKVPELFTLERYPTVWQMTSLVEAGTEADIPSVFRALFPCASITGAPKCKTMEIIENLESTPRGLYTGTIGYMGPSRRAQFNVAIRTAVINNSSREAQYGTGGGITWDSKTDEEYSETLAKARVLTERVPSFSLLETLLWEEPTGYFLLERHIDRMKTSAAYFGFPFDEETLRDLMAAKESHFNGSSLRIRLVMNRSGVFSFEESTPGPYSSWTLALAEKPVSSENRFLYHKTTHREIYRHLKSLSPRADDVLLWNQRGELTESCIGNLVIVMGGVAYTPPVASGLLAGTYRNELLQKGELEEKILYKEDLKEAEEIYLINSVRRKQSVILL